MTGKTLAVGGLVAALAAAIATGNFGVQQLLWLGPVLAFVAVAWFAMELLKTVRRIEAAVLEAQPSEHAHVS